MTDNNLLHLADWTTWQCAIPANPLELLASATLHSSGGIDTGVFLNSTTFAVPTYPSLSTPVVTAVDLASTSSGRILSQMPVPIITLIVNAGDSPDAIDITFNQAPDAASVNSGTFIVTISGSPVSGTIAFSSSTRVRFVASVPFSAGNTYSVLLRGSGTPKITFGGGTAALDGLPIELPSGNGSAGSNFVFQFQVVASVTTYYPGAIVGGWNPTLFALQSPPLCSALWSDKLINTADAAQWNIMHRTANLATNPALLNTVFLRAGTQWKMSLPLDLGNLLYPDLQFGFRFSAGTRGDCARAYPVISFAQRNYTGQVFFNLILKKTGTFVMGLRAIDARGNYFMHEITWNVIS